MSHLIRVLTVLVLLGGGAVLAPAAQAQGGPVPGTCAHGILPFRAISLLCVPASGWNGDLVIYAHGYTPVTEPVALPQLVLNGVDVPQAVQSIGYAFATTSYRQNGLAFTQGEDDIRNLLAAFTRQYGVPRHTYLFGASEGALVTTLLAEQSPQLFSGALSICGPIGDFRQEVNYLGDFHALFDYFFPGVIPGSPIQIPPQVISGLSSTYLPAALSAIRNNPGNASQLIATSHAASEAGNPASVLTTVQELLSYNVLGTNDATAKLGGNPFDNHDRLYLGSSNDLLLNFGVARFTASPTALANLALDQTSGNLTIPMVTLHTIADDVVPFTQEVLYLSKVHTSGHGSIVPIPIFRYGHCNFTTSEVIGAFALLVTLVNGERTA